MSMSEPTKISAKDYPALSLKVRKGHFASDRFHVNCYINMATLKMRHEDAKNTAKAMAERYVKRPDFSFSSAAAAMFNEHAIASMSRVAPIDTIICLDGCEVIGAYLADELSAVGVGTLNQHKTSYVITPEFDSTGQMVVRDNIQNMIKGRHVLIVLATAMSGRTIAKSLRCIKSYGGIIEGISVIFSAVNEIEGYPVNAVFTAEDLPDFKLSDPASCPQCQANEKLDAIINSYGYTLLD